MYVRNLSQRLNWKCKLREKKYFNPCLTSFKGHCFWSKLVLIEIVVTNEKRFSKEYVNWHVVEWHELCPSLGSFNKVVHRLAEHLRFRSNVYRRLMTLIKIIEILAWRNNLPLRWWLFIAKPSINMNVATNIYVVHYHL